MAAASMISRGSGDGTTRLQPREESLATVQACSAPSARACCSERKEPTGLVGCSKARSPASTTVCVITETALRPVPALVIAVTSR